MSQEKEKLLKDLIVESFFRLKKRLLVCDLVLFMQADSHVPDTLTRIRVLPSVAVVGQIDKVFRSDEGKDSLRIYVKFLPDTSKVYESVKNLASMIKKLPGIEMVKVERLGGRKINYKGKPIIV